MEDDASVYEAATAPAIGTTSFASHDDDATKTNISTPLLPVLTFVLTIEYNGYQYAGFQRQTPTFNPQCQQQQNQRPAYNHISERSRKTSSTSSHLITIQHQIEMALQQWTNLSIATLRVRGAGRTDKGVHASGQVVAFDVPVRLLKLDPNCLYNEEEDALSGQCIQHLQEAYHVLVRHKQLSKMRTRCGSTTSHYNATRKTLIDQWQIRRAITTRLRCSDIVIRSVRMYTGCSTTRPFEPRRGIIRKTYVYRLRFRRLARLQNNDVTSLVSSSSTIANANCDARHEKECIHPICHAGPHILRRIHDNNTVFLCPWSLDSALLHSACAAFVGRHNFVNFVHKDERKAAVNSGNVDEDAKYSSATFDDDSRGCVDQTESRESRPPPHEIDLIEFKVVESDEDEWEVNEDQCILPPVVNATFTLSAKGFHRSMVRNLVGFAVDVARGVRSIEDIPMLLLKTSRDNDSTLDNGIVNAAPACGLSLAKVEYEHDNFL
ncbi:hypothetical protein ACHAXA_009012 [Cyclostephanos tholiformis]|uniref:tRNA pseudouridine synthase n=1 Tax=Cyclostephanos tholiformis TaxID=382380 RepID=A0ABD3RE58_9STRA